MEKENKSTLNKNQLTVFGFFISLFSILVVISILKAVDIIDHDNWKNLIYILMVFIFILQFIYNIMILSNHQNENKGNIVLASLGIVLIFVLIISVIFIKDRKHILLRMFTIFAWMLYNVFMMATYVNYN